MRIAILGFSQPAVLEAPFDDPSWTVWGMNGLWRVLTKIPEERFALWFEPHTLGFLKEYGEKAGIGTQQQDWLAKPHPFPIMMQEKFPQFPASVPLDVDALVSAHRIDYFTSTVAYELAYALAQDDVEEIGLWGIDLVHGTEWGDQRPCAEYWLGRMIERGIKVTTHRDSALMSQRYRYAYDNPDPLIAQLRKTIQEDQAETAKGLAALHEKHNEIVSQLQTNDGARQMLAHLSERLDLYERGGRA